MHFEILIEDISGKKALDILLPKIIGNGHTFNVISFKGIGHLPKNFNPGTSPKTQQILNNIPKILAGYGKTYAGYGQSYNAVLFVVVDLDNNCLKQLRSQLLNILNMCNPKPQTRFCFAIEEIEAWLLGDLEAITSAYPGAKINLLNTYKYDSVCGTWELLADAVTKGGSALLQKSGYQKIGEEKSKWATTICPFMNVHENLSPSFNYFKSKIEELI